MNDLKLIKKHYGEKMMHFCRELFPTVLEKEGLLFNILSSKFEYCKYLYDDIINNNLQIEFKNFIYSFINLEEKASDNTNKTPKELMDEAGYDLFECKTEEDIQKFKKYYSSGEELCTFLGHRLDRCYVFFAVKKNVNKIKRENFDTPVRQDEYGTSVISIQFTKDKSNTLSIKNRYNHTVNNPDATFSNNLDNIISGLTQSFINEYNLNADLINTIQFEIPDYVMAKDGKYYKYNLEINNRYYCPNNIVIDNFEVKKFEKESYILFDYYVLDLKKKEIYKYDDCIRESFREYIGSIEKIEIGVDKKTKHKKIKLNDRFEIELNEKNCFMGYKDPCIKKVLNGFLFHNPFLEYIDLPKVKIIEDDFLYANNSLREISLPNVEKIGNNFIRRNRNIYKIDLPKVEEIGDDFLHYNEKLELIRFPHLINIGSCFICNNRIIKSAILPSVVAIKNNFLTSNQELENISFPHLILIGSNFINTNYIINSINLPNVEFIDNSFLSSNENLKEIDLPKVKKINNDFIYWNRQIKSINCPNLKSVDSRFLSRNNRLESISFPSLESVGSRFMEINQYIEEIDLPNLKNLGYGFLGSNLYLKKISLPNAIDIGSSFLSDNQILEEIDLPKAEIINSNFLYKNCLLKKINFPNLKKLGSGFLVENNCLEELYLPSLEAAEGLKFEYIKKL